MNFEFWFSMFVVCVGLDIANDFVKQDVCRLANRKRINIIMLGCLVGILGSLVGQGIALVKLIFFTGAAA